MMDKLLLRLNNLVFRKAKEKYSWNWDYLFQLQIERKKTLEIFKSWFSVKLTHTPMPHKYNQNITHLQVLIWLDYSCISLTTIQNGCKMVVISIFSLFGQLFTESVKNMLNNKEIGRSNKIKSLSLFRKSLVKDRFCH